MSGFKNMNNGFECFVIFFDKSVTIIAPELIICVDWAPCESTRVYFRAVFVKAKDLMDNLK